MTPLSHHQIAVGILSRELVFLLFGIVLHLPITILSFLMNNVEVTYIIVMFFRLLIDTMLFSIIAFIVGLFCRKSITAAMIVILFLSVGNFIFQEVISANSDDGFGIYMEINPFWIMSRQGIQLLPARIKATHVAVNSFLKPIKYKNDQVTVDEYFIYYLLILLCHIT